jgi:hypothetical protein
MDLADIKNWTVLKSIALMEVVRDRIKSSSSLTPQNYYHEQHHHHSPHHHLSYVGLPHMDSIYLAPYIYGMWTAYIRHGPYIYSNVDNGQRDSKFIQHDIIKSWCHSYWTCSTFEQNWFLHNSSQAIYRGCVRYTVYIFAIYCEFIRLAATLFILSHSALSVLGSFFRFWL